jgi:2-keto-4-pentenoate hydratase/2-oxohepta-3-ene-1,7-dioic acid hydratase in catechol pathway
MKLVTFELATPLGPARRIGALAHGAIVDLNGATSRLLAERGHGRPQRVADALVPPDMLAFLEGGKPALEAAQEALDALTPVLRQDPQGPNGERVIFRQEDVKLLAPLPRANLIRDFLAFEAHTRRGYERRGQEFPQLWYEIPVYYKGNPRSIVGPETTVEWPPFTQKFDYELEIACVIGKEGRDIPVERAHEYIAGYTIFNDFSARDVQMQEVQLRLGPAKGKDFATGMGPYLVTPDEVGDPRDLRMTAKVNGEIWSDGNSGTSHWTFAQMIAYVSRSETLYPGDVFGSGTVGGGCGYELDRWVQPGDLIELEITNLGVLRNRVGAPVKEGMHVPAV